MPNPSSPTTPPGRHNRTPDAEDERRFIRLIAPPVRRRTLVVGAIALLGLAALAVIGRPAAIPAQFSAAIPSVAVEITGDGEMRPWLEGESTGRYINVDASRGFFYDQWGRFEFTVGVHPYDALSSQSGGGLSEAQEKEAARLGAQIMSNLPDLPEEFVTALRAPDLTYRTVMHGVWLWQLGAGTLAVVALATAATWVRFILLIPMLRRRRRLDFYRCPRCGYDLTGREPPYMDCNECGCVWDPEEMERRVVV